MNELEFIKYMSTTIKGKKSVVEGIGDDAAVIKHTPHKYLLFASDMLIEKVHFLKSADPFWVGWKAVAVNISDIAAMGGAPKHIVVSIGFPNKKSPAYLKRIVKGIKTICDKFEISIVGGDTNASQNLIIDVSILGEVEKRNLVKRSTAKINDLIFVTGSLGEGRFKHLKFTPRVKEARVLVEKCKVNSMIDISDGLFLDLTRLCKASSLGARIYKSLIPVSLRAHSVKDALEYGEDFELLFTLSIKEAKRLIRYIGKTGYPPISLIGEIVPERGGLKFIADEGKVERIKPSGYLHF